VIIVNLIGEICSLILMQCLGYVNLMIIKLLMLKLQA